MKINKPNISTTIRLALLLILTLSINCTKKEYITIVQPEEPEPRVLWVPDDFETIQDAINASQDGDTVRVKAGTYQEGLRLFGKNIWLESETGPEEAFIDGTGWNNGITIKDGENYLNTTIRGFTIYSSNVGIQIYSPSGTTIYNCIFRNLANVEDYDGVWYAGGYGFIYNCIFDSCYTGITGGYSVGDFSNSIFIRCYGRAYNHYASFNNWITYGWNLFWNNEENYSPEDEQHFGDVFADLLFIEGSYVLSDNSHAIDAGDPSIQDKDGSRSDIGVHGGPYAYPIP